MKSLTFDKISYRSFTPVKNFLNLFKNFLLLLKTFDTAYTIMFNYDRIDVSEEIDANK